jgi:very-short-patch-repair endonuclease
MRSARKAKTRRSRTLRKDATGAEKKLWHRLRDRQIAGFKFVRQEPIGPFFADFVCRERKLIVEVDGGQHADSLSDERRTKWLASSGYKVVRFWNHEVDKKMEGVLEKLSELLLMPAPHPDR